MKYNCYGAKTKQTLPHITSVRTKKKCNKKDKLDDGIGMYVSIEPKKNSILTDPKNFLRLN